MTRERSDCPHCGRPMGFEYVPVEPGKCQLWRWMNESDIGLSSETLRDCFAHTTRRINGLAAALADAQAVAKAAQRALSRHHDAARAALNPGEFPNGARIE